MTGHFLDVQAGHFLLVAADDLQCLILPRIISGGMIAAESGIPEHKGAGLHKGEVQAGAVFGTFQHSILVIAGQVDRRAGIVLESVDRHLIERHLFIDDTVGVACQVHIRDQVSVRQRVFVAFLDGDLQTAGVRILQCLDVHSLHLLTGDRVSVIIVGAQQIADIAEGYAGRLPVLQRVQQVRRTSLRVFRPYQVIGIHPLAQPVGHDIIGIKLCDFPGGIPGCVGERDEAVEDAAVVGEAGDPVIIQINVLFFGMIRQFFHARVAAQLTDCVDAGQHPLAYAAVGPSGHADIQIPDICFCQFIQDFLCFAESGSRNDGIHRNAEPDLFLVNGADDLHIHRHIFPDFGLFHTRLGLQVF